MIHEESSTKYTHNSTLQYLQLIVFLESDTYIHTCTCILVPDCMGVSVDEAR